MGFIPFRGPHINSIYIPADCRAPKSVSTLTRVKPQFDMSIVSYQATWLPQRTPSERSELPEGLDSPRLEVTLCGPGPLADPCGLAQIKPPVLSPSPRTKWTKNKKKVKRKSTQKKCLRAPSICDFLNLGKEWSWSLNKAYPRWYYIYIFWIINLDWTRSVNLFIYLIRFILSQVWYHPIFTYILDISSDHYLFYFLNL